MLGSEKFKGLGIVLIEIEGKNGLRRCSSARVDVWFNFCLGRKGGVAAPHLLQRERKLRERERLRLSKREVFFV